MNILLINQFFWPDLAPTGQLLSDVASHLTSLGHRVSVICGQSVYAKVDGPETPPDVTIVRVGGIPFRRSVIGRSASYGAFLLAAMYKSLSIGHFDLVVTLTTPPLLSFVGLILSKTRRCKFFVWEMDVFPDSLVIAGLVAEGSPLLRILKTLSDLPRRNADGIVVLGECMRERLMARGLPEDRIHVAENWARPVSVSLLPASSRLTLLYSGNLGACHDVATVAAAAAQLRDDTRFRFIFAGGGARRKSFEEECRRLDLSNVEFLAYADSTNFAARLAVADIGLVTQTDASSGTVVPSKIYSLMAAGRPILFIGPQRSTAAAAIRRHECGWQIECGDSSAVIALLQRLAVNRKAVTDAGEKSRRAFAKHYTVEAGTRRIAEILGLAQAPVAEHSFAAISGSR